MRQTCKPVNRVDLVDQPLIGNARGVRPEQPELKILARIERNHGAIQQVALPVRVFFLQQRHYVGTAPAARLVHVPRHLHHHDVAELAGLDVLGGLHVRRRRTPLRADLHNAIALLDRGQKFARIGHGVRRRLFNVGIAAGLYCFNAVIGVLEIGGRDNDCIHILARIQLVVVAYLVRPSCRTASQ